MSNNALGNHNCPALMSDARFATDYRPSCYVHDLILKQNNIRDSTQMRLFMQRNANKLRDLNTQFFQEKAGCQSCTFFHPDPNGHDKHWDNYKQWLLTRK